MIKNSNLKYLIGKFITNCYDKDDYIDFITEDNYIIRINKFEPYCACYVGEYIDEIVMNGNCSGTITSIKENIKYFNNEDVVYDGIVTFYFEDGKINCKVHGEDNGYYGVSFTMPVQIFKKGEDHE